ncbi:MAG TPA: methyltransferase domain-containing protein [Candidatus Elarobacter sp.]|jgi:methionine biosynthesis protein MetW
MGASGETPERRPAASGRRKQRVKQYETTGSRTIEELDPNSSYAKAYALIPAGSRVLDLGCGAGELASYLAARGDRVWGVDINAAALASAAASCVATRVADLETADLVDLFPGLRFDVVVFADVLEHVREPWNLLQASRAVLDTGGRVVASIPNFAHAAVRLAVVSGSMPYRGLGILDDTHVRFFTLNGVASLFEESGFRLQEIARTTLPFGQPSELVPDVRLLQVPDEIERHVREDPENETLQFVVRAVMLPGEWDMGALRGRLHDVEARLEEQAIGLRNLQRDHAATLARAADAVAQREAAEARGRDLDAQVRALRAALDGVRRELAAAAAERDDAQARAARAAADEDGRAGEAQLAAGRHADLEREAVAATAALSAAYRERDVAAAALAAVERERDDALAALANDADARRARADELGRARTALREAIEQRDEARSVVRDARESLRAHREELARRLEAAQRDAGELQAALESAQGRGRALAEELAPLRTALDAATKEAAERAAAAQTAHERLAAQEARDAGLLAAADANRAALENALAHAKLALLGAIEERRERAAAARNAQELLARHDADAAAIREALRSATAELELRRERAWREALVQLAGEHDTLAAQDDGAQVWRNGAATR